MAEVGAQITFNRRYRGVVTRHQGVIVNRIQGMTGPVYIVRTSGLEDARQTLAVVLPSEICRDA